MSRRRTLTSLLTGRTPAVPVAICRIGLGVAAFGRSLKTARDLYLIQHDPSVVPAPVFSFPRIDTLPEIALVGGLGMAASIALTVGYRARLSAALLAGTITFLHVVDYNFWAHHVYFLGLMLLLLSLTESDAALSGRAWRGRGAPAVTAWPVLLMKIQLSLVYFFTGVAKLNPLFLSGYVLSSRSLLPVALHHPIVLWSLAGAAVAAELFLSFALWPSRLRPWGMLVGIALHVLVPIVFGLYAGLIVFSVATLGVYALFIDARDLAWIGRLVPPARILLAASDSMSSEPHSGGHRA
jgi:predicted small integral membrane protein